MRRQLNEQLADRAMRRGAGIVLHRPVIVHLQIASTCNLDCYMCSEHNVAGRRSPASESQSMEPQIFERIEAEILPWSSRLSLGIGGEPTISEHFVDFVSRAAGAGPSVQLTTNGTRFDRGEVAEVTARHVRALQVSVDAATAATYERIRRGASWERLLRGLEQLNGFRDDSPVDDRCHLTLCFTLMRSNVHELPAFVELASELRADLVHAQHVIPVTEEGRAESLIDEPERYDRLREEALDRAHGLGLSLELPQPYGGGNGSPAEALEPATDPSVDASSNPLAGHAVPCSHPSQSIYVLHDGRVFSCCHPFAHRKMQVGDLREQPFANIWNQRLLRNLRAGLRTGDVPAICHRCSVAHDPPPAREDPDALRESPDLARYYGERDLDPLDGDPIEWLESSGYFDYLADLRTTIQTLETERPQVYAHIASLEAERAQLRAHIDNLERLPRRIPLGRHVLLKLLGARISGYLMRTKPPTRDPR